MWKPGAATRPVLACGVVLVTLLTLGAMLPDRDAVSVRPPRVLPASTREAAWHPWPASRTSWVTTEGRRAVLVTPQDAGPTDAVTACFDAATDTVRSGRLRGAWNATVAEDARARVFGKTQASDYPAVAVPISATPTVVDSPIDVVIPIPKGTDRVQLCASAQGPGVRLEVVVADEL